MNSIENNVSDNMINRLMSVDARSIKDHIQLQRKGTFQSKTVRVGSSECSVDQLIQAIGKKINSADVTKKEPDLESLKAVLIAVNEAEIADRGITSSFFHLFSSHDQEMDKLQRSADIQIENHKAYETLLTGHTIEFRKNEKTDPLQSNLATILSEASHKKARIFITFKPDSKDGEWSLVRKNQTAQVIPIYIEEKKIHTPVGVVTTFVVALGAEVKNGELSISIEDVINVLRNKNS